MPRTPRPTPPVEEPAEETADEATEKTPVEAFIEIFSEDWAQMPLAAKLAKITGAVGNVPKKGINPNQNYRYARESDLIAAVRPYLAAAGIHINFSVQEHEIIPREAKSMLTRVRLKYEVSDGKEIIVNYMDGYGMDAGDKGVYKAITGAKKYVLMTLFLIDTGDEPEAHSTGDGERPKPQRMFANQRRDPLPGRGAPLEPKGIDEPPIVEPDDGQDQEAPPVISPLRRTDVVRGGHTTEATDTQRERLISIVRERQWSARMFLNFIRETLDAALTQAPEDDPAQLREFLNLVIASLTPEDMGKLLVAIERPSDGY